MRQGDLFQTFFLRKALSEVKSFGFSYGVQLSTWHTIKTKNKLHETFNVWI